MEMIPFTYQDLPVRIHSDGHVTISKTPKVTGKGQTYLVNHYLKEMEK